MNASVTIKKWKRVVFEEALTEAGITFSVLPGRAYGTLVISSEVDSLDAFSLAVKVANTRISELG